MFGTDPDCLPLTYSASEYFETTSIYRDRRGIIGVRWNTKTPYAAVFNELSDPSSTIALAELMRAGQMVGRYWGSQMKAGTVSSNPSLVPHDGLDGSNYLYTDGHVEKLNFFKTLVKSDGSVASTSNIIGTQWDAQ